MLSTPLTRLRKEAPGSLTAASISAYFSKRHYPRDVNTIGDFERGKYLVPPDRFVELYAEAIGQSVKKVRAALALTQRMRAKKSGPFAPKRVA